MKTIITTAICAGGLLAIGTARADPVPADVSYNSGRLSTTSTGSGAIAADANGAPYYTLGSTQPNAPAIPIVGKITLGGDSSGISFSAVNPSPGVDPVLTTEAHQGGANPTYVGFGFTYLLKVHTSGAATAYYQGLVDQGKAFFTAEGQYGARISGVAEADAAINTGIGRAATQVLQFRCDASPYSSDTSGCTSAPGDYQTPTPNQPPSPDISKVAYTLGVKFVSGSMFDGGDAADFYSEIFLGTESAVSFDDAGTAEVYLDPALVATDDFLQGLNSPDGSVTFSIAGQPASNDAAVPEPASWAMMVTGFGLLGGALRRGRRTVIA